jgi:DNA-binding response OmpR family regulator
MIVFIAAGNNMSHSKILIVEDEKATALTLAGILKKNGFPSDLAENGASAFDMYTAFQYPIVITDLEMPKMGGADLISKLETFIPSPVIFVTTAHSDPATIIEIMKMGIYDYLIKPVNAADIIIKIRHAFESAEIRRLRAISDRERIVRLENQLDWYKWQERSKNRDTKKLDKSLFHNLKTSFSQGAGFGSLITIVDLVISSAVMKNDGYLIEKEIFDLMHSNAQMAEKAITAFTEIDNLNTGSMPVERISFDALYTAITACIEDVSTFASLNNNTIRKSDLKAETASFLVDVNLNYLITAIRELLLNAFKFSEKNSDIVIIADRLGEYLEIEVLNIPIANDDGSRGIPFEYENIIFEPFFRLTKKIYEEFKTLDFGIGLTLVENVVAKHKGKVSAATVIDYSGKDKTGIKRVSFSILLPIVRN